MKTHQSMGMPINPHYYQSLFENYGFQVYFKQYMYERSVNDGCARKIPQKIRCYFAKS